MNILKHDARLTRFKREKDWREYVHFLAKLLLLHLEELDAILEPLLLLLNWLAI